MRNAFAILLAGALLAACGQRGALYLPDEQREQVGTTTPAATSSPTPEADADEREANARRNRGN
jgi:predicted small lipoprotein YifL